MRRLSRWRNGASGGPVDIESGSAAKGPSAHASVTFAHADPARRERRNVSRIRGQHQLRGLLNAWKEIGITHQVGDAQLRKAGLTRAEQLAGAAQFEIAAGDLEAVVGFTNHLEPF